MLPNTALQTIRTLIEADLHEVDELLRLRLRSEVQLAEDIGNHIVESGGKRLRAALVLLCGYALGGLRDRDASLMLAGVIEFIHTATLIHDDVVDKSKVRRGRDTVNVLWGDEASIVAGDFFYSRAFGMITEINQPHVTRILAEASNAIAEGELLELMYARQTELDETRYLTIIEGKTAKLFEASCHASACIEKADDPVMKSLTDYGRLLGAAFQIADDALDYLEDNEDADKNVGDDLASGRLTLPYIYALKQASAPDQAFLKDVIASGERDPISDVNAIMRRCGAIDYTLGRARDFAQRAHACLDSLPDSRWRTALLQVAEFSVTRKY